MQTLNLFAFMADTAERARVSGIATLPTESLRNRGGNRSPRKRALLARAQRRARDAGKETLISYF